MINIAICDDCLTSITKLSKYVLEYSIENNLETEMKIFQYENSMDLMSLLDEGKHFDILLLDIIMPNINGMEIATHIRRLNQVAKIIFLTSSHEFALASYSVNAFYYLLKPIEKTTLFSILDKAFMDINKSLQECIVVKTQSGLLKIFYNELIHVEVINRTVYFSLKNGDVIESLNTIHNIETYLLKDHRFIKPHRSYIVNLDYIISLSKQHITTVNDHHIIVSRIAYKKIKESYMKHMFNITPT